MSMTKLKRAKQNSLPVRIAFMRRTVTVPSELGPFVDDRLAGPQHAGNFSSYVRNLILDDRETHEKKREVTV